MCDPISATIIASEFAGSAAAYTAGTAAIGGGLGALGGAAIAGDMFLPGALAATGGFDAAGAAGLASSLAPWEVGTGSLFGGADLASGGLGEGFSGEGAGAFMDGGGADALGGGDAFGAASEGMSGAGGESLSSPFSGSPSTGADMYGGIPEDPSSAMTQEGFSSPDAGFGQANGPSNFSPAGDSQAYNASQPLGNRGLGGLYDNVKGAYDGVMNYSPFGSGGPTIGGAKNGFSLMNGLSSLYDMNAKRQIAGRQQDFQDKQMGMINGYGAEGTPERAMMQQELDRRDAAAGRNSQYGQRAVELNAKLANTRANYGAQTLGTGFKNTTDAATGRYGALNSAFFNAGNTRRTQ